VSIQNVATLDRPQLKKLRAILLGWRLVDLAAMLNDSAILMNSI